MRLELARRVLSLGKWIFIRTTALMLSFVLAGAVATRFGDSAIAAHQVAFQLWVFLALVLDSVAIAGQIIVGRELGAGRREEAYGASERMIWLSVALGGVFAALMLVLAGVLPRAFTGDASVLDETALLWPIFALMQPLNGAVFALDGILIGASDGPFLAHVDGGGVRRVRGRAARRARGRLGDPRRVGGARRPHRRSSEADDDALPARPLARHRLGVDDEKQRRSGRLQGSSRDRDSHSRISVLRRDSVEAVGDAREDHARLEEEQPLDVERALVVERARETAEDELRHDHDGDGVGICGDLAEVRDERIADVPEGASSTSSGTGIGPVDPVAPQLLGLLGVEREEHCARVLDPERRRVVGSAHRRRVRSGDEDPADGALRQLVIAVRCEHRARP